MIKRMLSMYLIKVPGKVLLSEHCLNLGRIPILMLGDRLIFLFDTRNILIVN